MRAFRLNLFVTIYLIFPLKCLPRSISSLETNEYYGEERDVLLMLRDSLKSSSNLHANWTGPPCHQSSARWTGIGCSDSHVTTIVLDGLHLTGSLPQPSNLFTKIPFLTKLSLRNNSIHGPLPDLTGLAYIQYVYLSRNHFSGTIPTSYIRLPKLIKLQLERNSPNGSIPLFNQTSLVAFNVSYNNLQGSIPSTKALRKFGKSAFNNNKDLCGQALGVTCTKSSPPPGSPSKSENKAKVEVWKIGLVAVVAILIVLLIMVVFLCCCKRHQRRETEKDQQGKASDHPGRAGKRRYWEESMEDPERTKELDFFNINEYFFDLEELLRASAEILGKGKVGTTYKAMLEFGKVVVVKRLRDMSTLTKREFLQHMHLLGSIKHVNLVEVVSFYYSKDEKLLISEFIPNGSLYELLHENRGAGRVPLNWNARLSIIKQIANGLDFLHQSFPTQKLPHGNLKSSNILILRGNTHNLRCKLSDYGLLPVLTSRRSTQRLAVARSPEFFQGRRLTHKADVYCFGIVVLEIITGKIPGDRYSSGGGSSDDLSDWVKTVVENEWSIDILDVEIATAREEHNVMLRLAEIALECTDVVPERRPNMSDVLRYIRDMEYLQTSI